MNNYRNAINSNTQIDEVIISCLRNSTDCQIAIDSLIRPHFDWHLFLKKLFAEGVDGLLFDSLSKWGYGKKLPAWVFNEMKQNYLNNLGRNLLLTTHLDNVLESFEKNKIEVLLLRGGDFLNRLYPKLGTRSMSDVDLVVHKQDMAKVKNLLENLEYKHPKGYPYLFENNALFIDLHADYLGSYKLAQNPNSPTLNSRDIQINAQPFKTGSVYVKTLSVYDAVISCCAHLQEHSFARLIWFYDIANLIDLAENDFDWNELVLKARKYSLTKPVFYVFKYLDTMRIIQVPKKTIRELCPLELNSFERRSLSMLLGNRRSDVSGELLYLFSNKGIIRKIKCLWQAIFIEKESFHLAVERITFWHYLKRFFTMSLYAIKKMFKLISI